VQSSGSLRFEQISATSVTDGFDCGKEPLNSYLTNYALLNHDSGISKTYLLVRDSAEILGYYAINNYSIPYGDVPSKRRHYWSLPKYDIPCALISRLAVRTDLQGQGIGKKVLKEALRNISFLSDQIGIYFILVDAIDEDAKKFYLKYGFQLLRENKNRLFMRMVDYKASLASTIAT
jgi:GNAT superfamily N-acetyltransferase